MNKFYFINQPLRNFLLRNFTKEILSRVSPVLNFRPCRSGEAEVVISSISLCQSTKYQRVQHRGRYKTVHLTYLKKDRPNGSSETGTTTITTTTTTTIIYCLFLLLRSRTASLRLPCTHWLVWAPRVSQARTHGTDCV